MNTLTLIDTKNHTTSSIYHDLMATTVGNIAGLISTSLQESESFQNYKKTLLQILNELGRQLLGGTRTGRAFLLY